MGAQAIAAGLATLLGGVLLFSMARTEQSREWLVLIVVLLIGVVLALVFGFMRKRSSGG